MNSAHQVVQIAYFVSDIEQAALDMFQKFGAGPFIVGRRIELESCVHRGNNCELVHSSAYGQWGDVMLELVQQDSEGASPFRDMYEKGEQGLHHTAMFVESMDASIEHFAELGIALATRAVTRQGGVEFAFLDATQSLGHMLEIYVGSPQLREFYATVKQAAQDWDGADLLR